MKIIFEYLLDFILPRSCIACKEEIAQGFACHNCLNNIWVIKSPRCPKCGRSISATKTCKFCRHEKYLNYGRAWALYVQPVDRIVHFFKYRRFTDIARFLGLGMANILSSDYYLKEVDMIVPVPLFWWKKLRRGYNQAQILSEIISAECGIKILNALRRIKNTRTQTKLDHKKRKENVLNAFVVKEEVKDKNVLLIDDVMTTGATIKECARVLKEAGAQNVYSLVAAITPG